MQSDAFRGEGAKKQIPSRAKGGSHLKREEAPARVHGGGDEGDRLVVEKAAVGVRGSRGMYLRAGRKYMNMKKSSQVD